MYVSKAVLNGELADISQSFANTHKTNISFLKIPSTIVLHLVSWARWFVFSLYWYIYFQFLFKIPFRSHPFSHVLMQVIIRESIVIFPASNFDQFVRIVM